MKGAMNKKKIDFEVNQALGQFKAQAQELGFDPGQEFLEEYKQALEGIAIRELAERGEDNGQFFSIPTYNC